MADKVDIYIPIYIGDYLGDTQDLTAEEHGAYLLILFTMWKTRAPILFDRLSSVAKVDPAKWPTVWGVIGRFFQVSAGLVTQGRLMRELEAAIEKKRRKSDAGIKSGESKRRTEREQNAGKPQTEGPTKAVPSPSPSEILTLPVSQASESDARSEDSAKPASRISPNWGRYKMPFDVTEAFVAVFARYPNQNGQAKAASAWCAIVEAGFPGGEPALREAIVARFDSGQLTRHPYAGDAKYRPSFETYLREFRWLDANSAPDDGAPKTGAKAVFYPNLSSRTPA